MHVQAEIISSHFSLFVFFFFLHLLSNLLSSSRTNFRFFLPRSSVNSESDTLRTALVRFLDSTEINIRNILYFSFEICIGSKVIIYRGLHVVLHSGINRFTIFQSLCLECIILMRILKTQTHNKIWKSSVVC